MLIWGKLFAGFSSLGAIALIPWSLASKEPEFQFNFNGVGGAETSSTLTQILAEKGEEGYKGCVSLKGGERGGRMSFLYVCINTKEENKSFLFYYDTSKKEPKERVKEVTHIEPKSSWDATVHLKGGDTKTLRTPPFWLGKWNNKTFNPKTHCEMKEENKVNYTLICAFNSDKTSPELNQVITSSK